MVASSKEREALLARFAGAAPAGQERPIRSVRRPLRARDVDGRDRAARARRRAHPAVGGISEGLGNELRSWVGRPTALTHAHAAERAVGR